MAYVEGFVLPVPEAKLADYRRFARKVAKIWRDHGALAVWECAADDVEVGKRTSFPRSVKVKPGETVVLAWVTFKSRVDRDRINAKVIADPRLAKLMKDPDEWLFDPKRMFHGGFKVLLTA